jgi:enoyl-[acyl-carrier protein] reductase I
MKLLEGKKALILGLANERSIAWGITKAFKEQGASVALSYMNEAIKKRVEPLSQEIGADFIFEMDVTNDAHYPSMRETVQKQWGKFDIIVHSLAFADKEDLSREFLHTSRKGFLMACDISAFSLVGITDSLHDLLNDNGSIISMNYYGSQKFVKNYNTQMIFKLSAELSPISQTNLSMLWN